MADEKSFASRWSTRKTAARQEQQAAVAPTAAEEPTAAEPAEDQRQLTAEDLPDIDTLDAESDYRVFMRDNVPEDLRARALRRLWRSSPLFSSMDGLDDYAEDFTDAALVLKEGITSAYKVGRGYAKDPVDEVVDEVPAATDDATEMADAEVPDSDDSGDDMGDDSGDDMGDDTSTDSSDETESAEATETEPPTEKT